MAIENLHVHKPNKFQNLYVFLLFLPSIVFVVVLVLYLSTIQKNKAASTYILNNSPITTPTSKNIFTDTVVINGKSIAIALADNNQERTQGLSILQSLPEDHGMLFVFPENSRPHFWMKNMNFAIDIIWIDDGKIVQIDENVMPPEPQTPDNELELYIPTNPIDYVLEVNAGFCQQQGILVGDSVTMP